jgi:glucose/arabinose dehydrogenase
MSTLASRRGLASAFFVVLPALAVLFAAGKTQETTPESTTDSPDITLQSAGSGLGPITSIANAGDDRLFVTIQSGRILIRDAGGTRSMPFLDVSSLVSCCGERGLLSVAFHPRYAQNGRFFVYYTNREGNVTIARYSVSSDPNVANPAGSILLTIPHPTNSNHNGGELQFGPDGYLYIGTGDGGSANDPPCNAQKDDVLLGKLLRIDVDQNIGSPPFYGIPPSNPFVGPGPPLDEIWAKGLRNPWRFSFDRLTGDLWIADVGQDAREEVDFAPRSSGGGENYGWKIMEGTLCGRGGSSNCPASVPPCNSPTFRMPTFEYDHNSGDCSITGGYVYRGALLPALSGLYFYGDYCTGRIWGSGRLLTPRAPNLTTFGEDRTGEIYLGTGDGTLFRILGPEPVARSTPLKPTRPRPMPKVLSR